MQGGRTDIFVLMPLAVLLFGGAQTLSDQQEADERVVRITASRFVYNPPRIELRKGEPVMLELISLDRMHGFNIPDLGLRIDVLPEQSVRVKLTPDKAGTYTFLCDIFCGDGHGEMSGTIVVKD
ncbi:MAG: cupredoxin domain-containing protein [Gammaproteobacteria bacterium]|nr:MAG: cupredoxin domain-containing protein [Gammaproteobacteria bacterium]